MLKISFILRLLQGCQLFFLLYSCGSSLSMSALFKGDASLKFSTKKIEVTEGAANGSITVSLASRPTADVSVAFKLSTSGQAILFPEQITFKTSNYDIPQVITIVPLSDCITDGDKSIHIEVQEVVSLDKSYRTAENPLLFDKIQLDVKDNPGGQPAILLLANEPLLQTAEDGSNDKFLVALSCQPSQDVTITLTSNDLNEGVLDQSVVVLNSGNYASGKLVTLTGQSDCVEEPDRGFIISAMSDSGEASFDSLSASKGAINKDILLQPAIQIIQNNPQFNRGIDSYNFFQVRMTCAPPGLPVAITVTVNAAPPTVALQTPLNHTFNNLNWNIPFDIINKVTSDEGNAYSITITTDQPAAYPSQVVIINESPTKRVSVSVSGLDSGEIVTLKNGFDSIGYAANGNFNWFAYANSNYQFETINPPNGKICAVSGKPFGIVSGNLLLSINCVGGYMVGGRFQILPKAPLDYLLYQGKVSTVNDTSITASPNGIAFAGGNMFVVKRGTNQIFRCLGPSYTNCSVFAGSGTAGTTDGLGTAATFYNPRDIISDGSHLYINQYGPNITANESDDALRKIDLLGNVITLAQGSAFNLAYSEGMALAENRLYIADRGTHQIKIFDLKSGLLTVYAGTGQAGAADGNASSATFNKPIGLSFQNGSLYIADNGNHKIRAIHLTTHQVTTVTGFLSGAGDFGDGPVAQAKFYEPHGLVSDGFDLYVIEYINSRIRRIKFNRMNPSQALEVMTIAGQSKNTYAAGIGILGILHSPVFGASDGRSLYISDVNAGNGVIAKLSNHGLVGYWPFAGNTHDYNNDGVYTKTGSITGSITSVTGRFGEANGAYYLDGTDDTITTPSLGKADTNFGFGDFSIAFWLKPDTTQLENSVYKDYDIISNWGSTYDFAIRYHHEVSSTATDPDYIPAQIIFARHDGSATPYCLSSIRIDDNRFHHITAQKQGNRLSLFMNGRKVCTVTDNVGSISLANVVPLQIGARPNNLGLNDFTGAISDLRIFSRALNEAEINELAQNADPNLLGPNYNQGPRGLLSHYQFNFDGTNPSLTDSGPLGLSLTSSGSPGAVRGKDGDSQGSYLFSRASTQSLQTVALTNDGLGLNQNLTITAWIKPKTLPGSGETYTIISRYETSINSDDGYMLALANFGGIQAVYWTPNGGASDINPGVKLPLNSWSHLAMVQNDQNVKIYINGLLLANTEIGYGLTAETEAAPIMIGRNRDTPDGFFNGAIDDIRIYNNALNQDQIRQIATQVPAGILARYDFNNDAKDVSGFGKTGTTTSTAPANDLNNQTNQALTFNGTSSFMEAPADHFPVGNAARTICSWVKPASNPTSGLWAVIAGYGSPGNLTSFGLGIHNNAGNIHLDVTLSTNDFHTTYAMPLNVWTHICASHNGSTLSAFVNGVMIASTSLTLNTTLPNGIAGLIIGRDVNTGVAYANAVVDDVRIYAKALDPSEIRALSGYHAMQTSNSATTMRLHLQADYFSNLGESNTVGNWFDSSLVPLGNGTANGLPLLRKSTNGINGREAVAFNGSNSYFDFGTPLLYMTGLTICGVYAESALATYAGIIEKRSASSSGSFGIVQNNGFYNTYFETPEGGGTANIGGSQNEAILGCFVAHGSSSSTSAYKAGTISSSGGSTVNLNNATNSFSLVVGRRYDGLGYFNGKIGDLLLYSQALTGSSVYGGGFNDREIVECYLSAKYGIALGHNCP